MSEEGVSVKYEGGADEPVDSTEQLIAVLELLNATLAKVQEETKKTGDDTDDTNKKITAMERATKAANDRFEQTQRVAGSMRTVLTGVGATLGVITGAYGLLTAGVVKFSEAGSDQERRNDRLSSSVKNLTDDVDEQRRIWGLLQNQIAQASQADTDFGDEEISDTLANLIDGTNDYAAAQANLDAVMGISVQRNKGLTEVSVTYAKAIKGNIEALAELTPLSKSRLATLQKITNDQERGAKAAEFLRAQYAGLANTTGTAGGALKDMRDVGGDVVQMLGMILNASGAVQAIVVPLTQALRDEEAALKGNSVEGQQLAITIGEYVVHSLDVMIEMLGTGAKVIYGTEAAIKAAAGSAEIFGRSVLGGAEAVLYFTGEVLGFALGQIETYLETNARIAETVGADGIAGELRSAKAAAAGFREETEKFSSDRLEGMKAQWDGIGDAVDGQVDALVEMDQNMAAVDSTMRKAFAVTDKMRAGLWEARQNVKELGDGFNPAATNAGKLADQVERIAETTTGMTLEEANYRAIILDIEGQLIHARAEGDKGEVARLELSRTQYQSELDLLGAQDQKLGLKAQENALLEATLTYQKELAEMQRDARSDSATRDVYMMRLAALQEEDELQRTLLEIEADRFALQYETLSDAERSYEVARLEREELEAIASASEDKAKAAEKVADAREREVQAAIALGTRGAQQGIERGIDTGTTIRQLAMQEQIIALKDIEGEQAEREIARIERLIELEQQRAEAMQGTMEGVTALGGFMATLSTQQWDLVEGQEAYIGALGAAGQIGAGISSLLIKDRAKLAAVEAIIQTGLGIGATAMFVKSGGIAANYGAAAVKHFTSAASMGIAAAAGGESAGGGAPSAGLGGGGSFSSSVSRPQEDRRSLTRDLTDAVREGFDGGGQAGAVNYYDMRAAMIMSDSPQGREIQGNMVQSDFARKGILPKNALSRP